MCPADAKSPDSKPQLKIKTDPASVERPQPWFGPVLRRIRDWQTIAVVELVSISTNQQERL